mgnify:FL=1
MRTGRSDVRTGGEQPVACCEDALPALRRSGFDDDEQAGSELPKPVDELVALFRRKLIKDVG